MQLTLESARLTRFTGVHGVTKEIAELNQIRLEDDLSIPALAEAIGLEPSTLHRLLFTPGRKPYDRTLFKVRRFLADRRPPARRRVS